MDIRTVIAPDCESYGLVVGKITSSDLKKNGYLPIAIETINKKGKSIQLLGFLNNGTRMVYLDNQIYNCHSYIFEKPIDASLVHDRKEKKGKSFSVRHYDGPLISPKKSTRKAKTRKNMYCKREKNKATKKRSSVVYRMSGLDYKPDSNPTAQRCLKCNCEINSVRSYCFSCLKEQMELS